MKRTGRKKEWSIALFCAGLIFVFPPILSIYNNPDLVFGLPITYLILYGGWGVLILAMAFGARRKINYEGNAEQQPLLKNPIKDNR
jgi:hypothetical protein